jgi:signal peptidase II
MRRGIGGSGTGNRVSKKAAAAIIPAGSVVVLDQLTKALLVSGLGMHEKIQVIAGFLDLVHIRNRGMAFGILNRPSGDWAVYALSAVTAAAVVFLLWWLHRTVGERPEAAPALSMIIGGAVGNLIDRLRLGEVVDFVDLHIGGFHWPAFNVADSAITLGCIWLVIILLRGKTR